MKFKNILKGIPLISAVFIFCGIFKAFLYYKFFGINIVNYISLQDALQFSISDLTILLILSIYYFLLASQFGSHLVDEIKNVKTINQRSKLMHFLSETWRLLTVAITILALGLFGFSVKDLYVQNILPAAITSIIFYSLINTFSATSLVKKLFLEVNDSQIKTINYFTGFFIFLICFSVLDSYVKYYNLINFIDCRNTSIQFKDSKINLYSQEFYIGETEKNVFTFSDDNIAKIYQKEDVKTIIIQSPMNNMVIDQLVDFTNSKFNKKYHPKH